MATGKAFVDNLLENHKVVVISKTYCPHCTKAKKALAQYKIDDLVIEEIENREDMNEIQDHCLKLSGARSVPRVFIKGKCIGGGSETESAHKDGTLKKLLDN